MIWLAGLPGIWWAAILIADAIQPGRNLFELMEVLTEKLNHPFQLHYTEYTIKSVLVCTLLYAAGIGIFYSSQKNYRRGEEHGSARWGDARQICDVEAVHARNEGKAASILPVYMDLPCIIYHVHLTF